MQGDYKGWENLVIEVIERWGDFIKLLVSDDGHADDPEADDADVHNPAVALDIATEIRAHATSLYKLTECIRYLDVHKVLPAEHLSLRPAFQALLSKTLLKSALVAVRVQPPSVALATTAVQSASRALSMPDISPPGQAKALYRRALAHVILKNEQAAENDLAKALVIYPTDAAIAHVLVAACTPKQDAQNRQTAHGA
ncbi:hypothetical protein B0H14DRAFT_3077686 [Mycena olivaceomarginata]|nr:hypothetical protein B0H14DRAFT_3077686 [Mycena olivaceomarginata]